MKKRDFLKGMLGIAGAVALPGTIDKAFASEILKPVNNIKDTKPIWLDTSAPSNSMYVYDGTNWKPMPMPTDFDDDAIIAYKLSRSPDMNIFGYE